MRPEDIRLDDFEVSASRAPIRVTWLGTAGFAIEHDGHTLLIDPYVTRASIFDCLRAPLRSDRRAPVGCAPVPLNAGLTRRSPAEPD